MKGFNGDIIRDKSVLAEHSKDASAFKVMPSMVLYPRTVADIVTAVKEVSEEKKKDPEVSLSVRAGGTCMSGGSLNTGYKLNLTKYMNGIEINPKNQTATVEMGAYFRDIETAAAKYGLMYAPYTSSHLICGIGGMIGNNASGEKSIRYGAVIDNVISLEVVLADGSIIHTEPKPKVEVERSILKTRESELLTLYDKYGEKLKVAVGNVPKVSSGYRLERVVTRISGDAGLPPPYPRRGLGGGDASEIFDEAPLFVGAQGTLGIVTKAVLKLVPQPKFTRLLIISIDSIHNLPFVLKAVLKYNPEGVETFDINTYNKAKVHNAADAERIAHAVHETTSCIILAQLGENTADETNAQAKGCLEELKGHDISVEYVEDQGIADAAWRVRRAGYLLMRDHNEKGFKAVPCIEDVIVPIESFDVFIEGLVTLIHRHKIDYGFHGHIGDGALRIIPVFDFNDPEVADKIIYFMHDVFALVKSVKGNTSADHGDGIIRTPFLEEFYGKELYGAFQEIKKLYDPQGIFNPCKKIGGTEEHIRKYLDRD